MKEILDFILSTSKKLFFYKQKRRHINYIILLRQKDNDTENYVLKKIKKIDSVINKKK